jgi:hypothetical protein
MPAIATIVAAASAKVLPGDFQRAPDAPELPALSPARDRQAQQRSPPPAPWGSSVDMRPDLGVQPLPNPGDQGTVSPLPGGSPRPAGEAEGQGTRFTPGGSGTDLGGAGKDSC